MHVPSYVVLINTLMILSSRENFPDPPPPPKYTPIRIKNPRLGLTNPRIEPCGSAGDPLCRDSVATPQVSPSFDHVTPHR